MTDKKKTEELNEAELDQVTGGVYSTSAAGTDLYSTSSAGTQLKKKTGDKTGDKGFMSTGSASPTV